MVAALICAPLAAHAEKSNTVCEGAVDTAYKFVENAFKARPEIAYSPVRTETETQLLNLACMNGFNHGVRHDISEMDMMYQQLRNRVSKKGMSVEEARYLVGDMAMLLAYKAGYIAGVK